MIVIAMCFSDNDAFMNETGCLRKLNTYYVHNFKMSYENI